MNFVKLAKLVSIILGEYLWLPLLLALALLKTGLSTQQIYILFPGLLLFSIIIPLSYIFIGIKLKKITEWDLPKRQERKRFLIFTFFSYLISVFLIYLFGTQLLFHLSLIIIVNLVILAVITRFWQISIHSSLNTSSTLIINFLFNWQLPWLYLAIPVIYWSRLKLKRHNLLQLFAGSLLSIIVILSLLKIFGYI